MNKKNLLRTSVLTIIAGTALTLWAGSGYECECFNPWQSGGTGCANYCEYDGATVPCGSNAAPCGFICKNVTFITRQCYAGGSSQWVYPGSQLCESCKFVRCAGGTPIGRPMTITAPPNTGGYSGIGQPCDGF